MNTAKNIRKNCSNNELLILYNQVGGICPKCLSPLCFESDGKQHKKFEIAHIYPLNPTIDQEKKLIGQPLLFEQNVNSINNLIALCPNCHTEYDKATSIESYLDLYKIKSRLIDKDKISKLYSKYTIEEELIKIVNLMSNGLDINAEKIEYESLKIDNKVLEENKFLSRKIKNDVTDYYLFLKSLFASMDGINSGRFNLIAGQINSFYNARKMINIDQNRIYKDIAEWLDKKLNIGNVDCCEIIVSFFVQNCEVFEDVSK